MLPWVTFVNNTFGSRGIAMLGMLVVCLFAVGAAAQDARRIEAGASAARPEAETKIAVLPFRLNSANSIGFRTGTLDELLAERIETSGEVSVVDPAEVQANLDDPIDQADRSEAELRALASRLGIDAIVTGSLTELAGRFSLDVRLTPAQRGVSSTSLVVTADSDRELLSRLGELADGIVAAVKGRDAGRIVSIEIEGAGSLDAELRGRLELREGGTFDPIQMENDRRMLEADPRIANVEVRAVSREGGTGLVYDVVRADRILGEVVRKSSGKVVAEIVIRGNKRVQEDAIRARIRSAVGEPFDPTQIARDVRALFKQGFFRDVDVFAESLPSGVRLTFSVSESPVVREIAIVGNDNIDADKIKDALTLTTGAPLDFPLLRENTERVAALYRSEGYYLAKVSYEIEDITEGSIAINFEVSENEKLKLREIQFEGNTAFSDDELQEGFSTKTWRFYSFATSWLDKTGTYSEPIFLRDLRLIEKKYTDDGYVKSRVGQPEVIANEDGLFLKVSITEGPQFTVGKLSIEGDETVDLEALREKIQLEETDIFSRSSLTSDVEVLEAHFTDRGFFFANVSPITQTNEDSLTVDVQFVVEKGPLYFVRNIDIRGNTRTIDSAIRREIRLVEGQLYSARALQVSSRRIRRLGFFEDVAFEPNTTEDPSQLDLDVNVVERPTGSFSFGAGFSSADSFIFTASLAETNLFGRGYGANISADIGGNSSRYFVSLTDPYFLGTTFSFSATAFLSTVEFDDFEQDQQGIELAIGHSLTVDNRASIALRYGFSQRKVTRNTDQIGLAAPIARQVLQGDQSTSRIGISTGIDTRNDRFAPTAGYALNGSVEYAGLGGFSKFLSFELNGGYYFGAPGWLFERSTFVVSSRMGYAVPFNHAGDFDLGAANSNACQTAGECINAGNLEDIDDDIRLPLTERYFLGGLGRTRLRGYDGRSVGPRRPILRFTNTNAGRVFHPVGTRLITQPGTNQVRAVCEDRFRDGTFGNGNGRCNSIDDKYIDDFADIDETQVIGGSSFISSSFEYRFPISEEIGLMGFGFIDGGNAFAEGDILFDASEWRYGYGGGVLWFSPFGPLQLVLGFPVDPESFEDSPVFEFSVGGLGI